MRIVLHTWLLNDRCLPKNRHTVLLQSLPSARSRESISKNKAPWDAPGWWHRIGLYWLLRIAFCCCSGDRHIRQAPVITVQFSPFSKLSLAMHWSSFTQRVPHGTHTGENFQMCPSVWRWEIRAHLGSLPTTLWQGGSQFLYALVKGVALWPAKFPLHYSPPFLNISECAEQKRLQTDAICWRPFCTMRGANFFLSSAVCVSFKSYESMPRLALLTQESCWMEYHTLHTLSVHMKNPAEVWNITVLYRAIVTLC